MLTDPNHSDQELLQGLVTGCERSFEVLFKKYHGYLYHYSNPIRVTGTGL